MNQELIQIVANLHKFCCTYIPVQGGNNSPMAATMLNDAERLQVLLASTKTPSWLPSTQEVDAYSPQDEKLRAQLVARRARLKEREAEQAEWCWAHPSDEGALERLGLICDELEAVEGELGWPEPQEPLAANEPKEPDEAAYAICDGKEADRLMQGFGEMASASFCLTCLCLLNHEDPSQSCQCGKGGAQ